MWCEMKMFLMILQIFSAVFLVITVLMHSAKAEGMGGIGGTARLFGTPKGLEQGLDKITTGLAVSFILISLILGIMK